MIRARYNTVNNVETEGRPNPPYPRTRLRLYLQQKWLVTALGVIGLAAGIILIIQNEARAVQLSRFLEETISLAIPVDPSAVVDKANYGKLVYLTGVLTIHEPLTEVDYGISVMAVKLLRQVQMYQWVETEVDNIDAEGNVASTSYTYYPEWRSDLVESSLFHTTMGHRNPKEFPITRQTQINENVKIGNYYLGPDLKKIFKDFIAVTGDERPERRDIKLHSGMYYHCQDIWKPDIGDVRIQFFYAGQHGQVVTIVARLHEDNVLVPYTYNDSFEILFLRTGTYTLEGMFALLHYQNKFLSWMMRGLGWLLLYLSCMSLTNFLQLIVSNYTFLQEILPLSHSSMKMTVSMCLSLLITAMAWVWYRPVLGIGLIIVTILLLLFTKWFSGVRPNEQYNRL